MSPASQPDYNRSILQGQDEYAKYFAHLARVFALLLRCYETRTSEKEHHETEVIKGFLGKLLYTVEALRMKYLYEDDHQLLVDMTESGFPNNLEIAKIALDLTDAAERAQAMPHENVLRQEVLNYLFERREDPRELLRAMAERAYLGMLEKSKIFRAFTPGTPVLISENGSTRSFIFSWGCYDADTNRPYVHILFFDQSKEEESLERKGEALERFYGVISTEGARVPDVGVLAIAIDQALDHIRPKVLKRIGIGPLYGPYCVDEHPFRDALGADADGFVLQFSNHIVYSAREEVAKSFFSRGKVRQIFYLPETNPEVYAERASKIYRFLLMPHAVAQRINFADERFAKFRKHEVITCNNKGEVHGKQ